MAQLSAEESIFEENSIRSNSINSFIIFCSKWICRFRDKNPFRSFPIAPARLFPYYASSISTQFNCYSLNKERERINMVDVCSHGCEGWMGGKNCETICYVVSNGIKYWVSLYRRSIVFCISLSAEARTLNKRLFHVINSETETGWNELLQLCAWLWNLIIYYFAG
jgi:hypothetical protein